MNTTQAIICPTNLSREGVDIWLREHGFEIDGSWDCDSDRERSLCEALGIDDPDDLEDMCDIALAYHEDGRRALVVGNQVAAEISPMGAEGSGPVQECPVIALVRETVRARCAVSGCSYLEIEERANAIAEDKWPREWSENGRRFEATDSEILANQHAYCRAMLSLSISQEVER